MKGIESVRYFEPIIWNNTPIEIRSIKNFDTFKTEIRKWNPITVHVHYGKRT